MIKKINDYLAGWQMTIIGGVFLLASFVLPRVGVPAGESLAWVCVVICGIPLLNRPPCSQEIQGVPVVAAPACGPPSPRRRRNGGTPAAGPCKERSDQAPVGGKKSIPEKAPGSTLSCLLSLI